MQVVNREYTVGSKELNVKLSGEIRSYLGTVMNYDEVNAPMFKGCGLTAIFVADLYNYIPKVINNPRWVVFDSNQSWTSPLLTIEGFEAELNIAVHPVECKEKVSIDFKTDKTTGEYEWRGLKESGLPLTIYTPSYTQGVIYTGTVNGVEFSADNSGNYSLTDNYILVDKPYPPYVPGSGAGGWCRGEVTIKDVETRDSWEYYTEVDQVYDNTGEEVTSSIHLWSYGNKFLMQIINGFGFSDDIKPAITTSIITPPYKYSYSVTERHGLDIADLKFKDVNGKEWSGTKSETYKYLGEQTVTAVGKFKKGGEVYVMPEFDGDNSWHIRDKAPSQVGGVTVTNIEKITSYVIEETDPETKITKTYKPDKVLVYAPLGDDGDLSGNLTFAEDDKYTLDDFKEKWEASGGTLSGHTFTVTANGAVKRNGYKRDKYTAETDDTETPLTEAELIPHLPHHNLIELNGANLPTKKPLTITITAKGQTYKYQSQRSTATKHTFDLTRPVGGWKQDTKSSIYDICLWERYTKKGEKGEYINEDLQMSELYGAILYSSIELSGFSEGTYTLTSLTTAFGSSLVITHTGFEFKEPAECGYRGDELFPSIKLYRNRYLTIMRDGRYIESFSNLKSVTDMGYTTWLFPHISELTDFEGGNRLLYPRDDTKIISFTGKAPVGGSDAPVGDMVSTAAYIGWLEVEGGSLKIKPTVDYINIDTRLYDGELELKCVLDVGAVRQGFVNSTNDTLEIDDQQINDVKQYAADATGDVEHIQYTANGKIIYEADKPESIPAYLYRLAFRRDNIHGYIWRNASGKILRNAGGIILRGDYIEEEDS